MENVEDELDQFFKNSDVKNDIKHKKAILNLIKELGQENKEKFGLLIILGYNHSRHKDFILTMSNNKNIFNGKKDIFDEEAKESIKKTIFHDGAILILKDGTLERSGVQLDINLIKFLNTMKLDWNKDLASQLGFSNSVSMRHLSGISSSLQFKGTTVFTRSEETGDIRVYEEGKILFSTVPEELDKIKTNDRSFVRGNQFKIKKWLEA